ncbi:MAG: glycosyltransferase, partial [Planctomycetes bacterium]|nr:glycosyltransferase [Planctomycetota bacterium]
APVVEAQAPAARAAPRASRVSGPELSVTVSCWNRARQLEGLLENVLPFAQEVVVVDGGSDDDTAAVCRAEPKVRYLERPWDGHFAKQKNATFAAARGDWILHLDVDERVGPRLVQALPRLCRGWTRFWRLPMLWLVDLDPPRYVKSAKHFPCPVPRLFQNRPEHRYLEDEGPVHPRFPKAITRSMKKAKGVYLLHYVLAWSTREELLAKAADYARREPGSEATNAAYYLWWQAEHEVLPLGDLA